MRVRAYRLTESLPSLLRRFEAAQAADTTAEVRVRTYSRLITACLVGAGASVFVGFFGFTLGLARVLWLVPALLLAAFILGLLRWLTRLSDVDDRRLRAVVRVLRMLHADTPTGAEAGLLVDFRSYDRGGQKTGQQGRWYNSVRSKQYRHEWFRLTGALADGTRYLLAATDIVSRKERRKRKYTKIRERHRGLIQLQLRLRPETCADVSALATTLRGLPAPARLRVKSTAARGRRLVATLAATGAMTWVRGRYGPSREGTENLPNGDMLLQTMLWAYDGIGRSLAPAR